MRRTTWWLATLAAVLLGVAAPAAAEVGVTADRILIGTSQSFSGPLVFPGTEEIAGIEAYLEYVNQSGGIHGRKIEWKWYDDGYKPQDAVANMKRLVEQDQVFCILINQGTSPVMAVVPYLEQKKVPLMFPFQGSSRLHGKKYVFTSFTYYDTQTQIVTRWLVEKKGFKRIGIIYQDDAYGKFFLNTLKKELKAKGLKIAAAESVKRGATDVAPQVAKIAQAGLDACLLALVPGPGAQVLKEAAKIGLKKTKLISSGPLTDEKFLILSGGVGEGVWGLSLWPDPVRDDSPAMQEYRKILKKYRPGHEPNRYNLYGYFYTKLFCEGLKRAGKDLTREKLIQALESIQNWENGIIPPVSFGPGDHQAQDQGFMVEVQGGRFVPISGWLGIRDGKLVESPL
ncbi:ABC transporter substrate-binding protein [Deferrisoma camini]|uniref:ABC transporter substrate-binding protein n=1 Tax=Deferrisoma camini TaxID=1035120 RepID=UPI00046C9E0F|nr:ABC transporter substrate-binding protein [Deferrisoma camini]